MPCTPKLSKNDGREWIVPYLRNAFVTFPNQYRSNRHHLFDLLSVISVRHFQSQIRLEVSHTRSKEDVVTVAAKKRNRQ